MDEITMDKLEMEKEKKMKENKEKRRNTPTAKIEDFMEKLIFSSRWLLAPIFIGLVIALGILAIKFVLVFIAFIPEFFTMSFDDFAIAILHLLDLALLGCLVLLVTFSGYENFVSKINPAEIHDDRPTWLGRLDFTGLKLKIVSSVVAISLIELLRDFLVIGAGADPHVEIWRAGLHMVFVVSGFILACMVYIGEKKPVKEEEYEYK